MIGNKFNTEIDVNNPHDQFSMAVKPSRPYAKFVAMTKLEPHGIGVI